VPHGPIGPVRSFVLDRRAATIGCSKKAENATVIGATRWVVIAFALAGCGTSVEASPSASSAQSLPPALAAGTYTSNAFQPPVTFTLPGGWWIPSDSANYLGLQPVTSDAIGVHLFRDPLAASQDLACPSSAEPGVGGLSTELATWIRGLEGLEVSTPRMATVGDLRGVELDIAIAADWAASCPFANGLPTVPLFVGPNDGLRWVVAGNERLRLWLLDVPGGGTVVVDIDAFDGSLMDSLLVEAAPIVRSFGFQTP
jgi:hypothetical protein